MESIPVASFKGFGRLAARGGASADSGICDYMFGPFGENVAEAVKDIIQKEFDAQF